MSEGRKGRGRKYKTKLVASSHLRSFPPGTSGNRGEHAPQLSCPCGEAAEVFVHPASRDLILLVHLTWTELLWWSQSVLRLNAAGAGVGSQSGWHAEK